MKKTMFFWCEFGRNKILDSQNSIDSIGYIDYVDSIDSLESEDSTDSKGDARQYQWGLAPIGTIGATLCVWCGCWRSFVWHEYRIYRIYKIYRIYRVCRIFRLYRVYRAYTDYRIHRIYRILRIQYFACSKSHPKKLRFIIRLFSPRGLRKIQLRI